MQDHREGQTRDRKSSTVTLFSVPDTGISPPGDRSEAPYNSPGQGLHYRIVRHFKSGRRDIELEGTLHSIRAPKVGMTIQQLDRLRNWVPSDFSSTLAWPDDPAQEVLILVIWLNSDQYELPLTYLAEEVAA